MEWGEGDPIIAITAQGIGLYVQVHNVMELESTDPMGHDRACNGDELGVVNREGPSVVSGGV